MGAGYNNRYPIFSTGIKGHWHNDSQVTVQVLTTPGKQANGIHNVFIGENVKHMKLHVHICPGIPISYKNLF